jgi:hypothetical protein
MNPVIDPADLDWLNGRQSCRALGCSPSALQRAALVGQIKTKLTPGVPIRYCRADIERIAATRTAPATAGLAT